MLLEQEELKPKLLLSLQEPCIPIIPKLINPAYPHWMLAPIVITAEIKQRHKIDNAMFQDCKNPTKIMSPNIIEYALIMSRFFLIKLSL